MHDISFLLYDSDFASNFTIYRNEGSFELGRFVPAETEFDLFNVIQPSSPKDIEQIPEADRLSESIVIYTKTKLYVTSKSTEFEGLSDQVLWNEVRYKIVSITNWGMEGFYKCLAVRMVSS